MMNISTDKVFKLSEALNRTEEAAIRSDRFPMMRSIRKEVRQFMHAAETLLGPIVAVTDLSQDERDVIWLYIHQIMEKFPDQDQ
jgi:hypothetical protein